jgi:hypothetical protein
LQLDDGGTGGAKWGNLVNVSAFVGPAPKWPGPGAGTQLPSGRLVMGAGAEVQPLAVGRHCSG